MTVSSTTSSETFACNGVTTVFVAPFRVLDVAAMRGYLLTIATGESTPLINGTDFTVTGVGGANTTVTTAVAYSALYQFHVKRITPRLQETDYRDNDPFPAESHEACLDLLTHIVQEDAETLSRALVWPDGETAPVMPTPADRANKVWANNSDGDLVFVVPSDGSVGSFALDLANNASAIKGAGMVGYGAALTYAPNTVGAKLNESVSVLDFGAVADGVTNCLAAFQAAVDHVAAGGGGVVRVPAPGVYKMTGTLYLAAYVHLSVDDAATIDCRASTDWASVMADGTLGAEVAISAPVTSGDIAVSSVAAHGLAVGDWFLLKSQRACLHADAGLWRLGETTSGATQPFFAEPLQVAAVGGATQVSAGSGVIFPDYKPDALSETYAGARPAATIAKINFVEGVKVTGGKWLKSDAGKHLIRMSWCRRPHIDIPEIQLGASQGSAVYLTGCFAAATKAMAQRPPEWTLGGVDHSAFNSFRDVGAWYCEWDVEDWNGSQGWDQSYLSGEHPSIAPRLKMRSVHSHETGGTTHGACYGADIEVEAFSPTLSGFFNRAPFSRIKLRLHGDTAGGTGGLILGAWGAVGTHVHDTHIANCPYGIDVNPVGDTDTVPPNIDLTISGVTLRNITAGAGIFLRDRATVDTTPSGITMRGITMRDVQRGIYVGDGWHGAVIDGASITRCDASGATRYGIEVRPKAGGCRVRNVIGYDIGASNYLVRSQAVSDSAVKATYKASLVLDEPSIALFGTGTKLALPAAALPQYLAASGTYIPVLTASVNSTPGASPTGIYSIVGDVVTVALRLSITAPASGQCRTLVSLPTPGVNFSTVDSANGVGQSISQAAGRTGAVFADVTVEQLVFEWYASAPGENYTFSITAQYMLS